MPQTANRSRVFSGTSQGLGPRARSLGYIFQANDKALTFPCVVRSPASGQANAAAGQCSDMGGSGVSCRQQRRSAAAGGRARGAASLRGGWWLTAPRQWQLPVLPLSPGLDTKNMKQNVL